jgi:pyruvate/2-oxoglutarate dehydrogenase complex dihydrolipoamide acyltransferase (E2) component
MLLKLLLPPFDRLIDGGTILAWHKAEGDLVDYGDDLFDLQVHGVWQTRKQTEANLGEYLKRVSQQLQQLRGESSAQPVEKKPSISWRLASSFVLRICSSDRGTLRRIHVGPGQSCQVGGLTALLTSETDEPIGEGDKVVEGAGEFRAVCDLT